MKIKSLSYKITLPVTVVLLIIIFVIIVIMSALSDKKIERFAQEESDYLVNIVQAKIKYLSQKALLLASTFSQQKNIIGSYYIANDNAGREFLKSSLNEQIDAIRKLSGVDDKLRIHFHKPPAVSFWRIWRKNGEGDGGDSLQAFRNSILKVYHTQKPVMGVELGKGGLVIRGIVPIIDSGRYIGSVENFYSFSTFFKTLDLQNNQNLVALLDKKAAGLAWRLKDNPKIGNYTFVMQAKELDLVGIDESVLPFGAEQKYFVVKDNQAITVFPIMDFEGKPAGVLYFSQDLSEIRQSEKNALYQTLLIIVVGFIVLFIAIFITSQHYIIKPLKRFVKIFDRLVAGNLNVKCEINQEDEIGYLSEKFNVLAAKQKEVVSLIVLAAEKLDESKMNIESLSSVVNNIAGDQSASIEEISASMEQMTSNIQLSTENTNRTRDFSENVTRLIKDSSDQILNAVSSLEVITEKVKVIDSIAFQTNILALNASVEAARAGVHGKGFGVVASEVGKLAERSKTAAHDIDELSADSVKIVAKTKGLLAEIVKDADKSSVLISEIALAGNEQLSGANQVNNAVAQLNSLTQSYVANTENLVSGAKILGEQADRLTEAIAYFKI